MVDIINFTTKPFNNIADAKKIYQGHMHLGFETLQMYDYSGDYSGAPSQPKAAEQSTMGTEIC